MDIALIVISAVILGLLVLMWLRTRGRHKCRGCYFFAEHYITSLHGKGLFRYGYCERLVHDTPMVEPDIERVCVWYLDADEVILTDEEKEQRRLGGR